jgi:hypothetical protein
VQDAALVRVVDCPRHLRQQPDAGAQVGAKVRQPRGEAAAVHQLHGKEVLAGVFADLVDRHDVRVIQPGGRLRLQLEAADGARRGQALAQDHLQGHGAVQRHLAGPEDDAHTAAGDLFQQLVAGEQVGRRGALLGGGRSAVGLDGGSGSVFHSVRSMVPSRRAERVLREV